MCWMETNPDTSDLVCPVTHQKIRPATPEELELVRKAYSAANSSEPLSSAVVTVDSTRAYPVVTGIPVLLADAAILLPAPAPSADS